MYVKIQKVKLLNLKIKTQCQRFIIELKCLSLLQYFELRMLSYQESLL